MDISSNLIAREILDVIPIIMRTIRTEMRSHRGPDLSVPQYRAMNYIHKNPGASLSGVADHIGLTLPSTSKLVDGLVERKLLTRQECVEDRRRINLELTPHGKAILDDAYRHTQAQLALLIDPLSNADRQQVLDAMRILQLSFSRGHETETIEIEKGI